MKISKLRKLKKWILDEPRRYNQGYWIDSTPDGMYVQSQKPPCGTVACIAGSACLMEGYKPVSDYAVSNPKTLRVESIKNVAMKILGLGPVEAHKLFQGDCGGWSKKAREAYENATLAYGTSMFGMECRAKAAAMELDRLIKKEERKAAR